MAKNKLVKFGMSFNKLFALDFEQSKVDNCVFWSVIFIVYVHDEMFLGKSEHQLSNIVKKLQGVGLDIEDQGHPKDYVSVNIQKHDDGSYECTQCDLIDSIIEDIGLSYAKATTKPVLATVQKLLHAFKDSSYFNNDFSAQSFANSTTLLRQRGQTLFMSFTNVPISQLILIGSMKILCIWSDIC